MFAALFVSLLATAAQAETACVTGAGGYVASEIVKQLLEIGFDVRGSVRSLKKKEKFKHLVNLDRALPGTLTLMEADLLVEGSFDKCTQGATYVFHTASPFYLNAADGQAEMLDPAVKGTENVIRSSAKAGAKRVIVTSSFASVNSFTGKDKPKGDLYSEEDWNVFTDDDDWKDNSMQMYIASKPLAEKRGLELAKELGIEMVAVLPSLVMGPILSERADSTSVNMMKGALEGGVFPVAFPWCDVRDVATAHVEAALLEDAQSRYIVSHAGTVQPSFLAAVLTKHFPEYEFAMPAVTEPNQMVDNRRVQELIGDLWSLERTIVDMARSMYQSDYVKGTPKGSEQKSEL